MVKTQALTIMFCDLVSSTERRARLGDDAYDEFNKMLFVVLRESIRAHGGREVGNAGDGMMIVFPNSVVDSVTCATEMHAEAAKLDEVDPPHLRIGISCGEVAQDGENYSGMPIVEAARLESRAAPGQTLANAVVRTLVGTRRALRFRDIGSLALKGIPAPLATVEVIDAEVAEGASPSTSTPRRNRLAYVIVALVVITIAAIVVLAARSLHTKRVSAPELATTYAVSLTAKPCDVALSRRAPGLSCATLTVPEDRSKPHGRAVKLDVLRAPARVKTTNDPVLDFGADDLASSPARDHSDEIVLAQRGWGRDGEASSDPILRCQEYTRIAGDALVKPSGNTAETERDVAAFHQCHDRLTRSGIDLNQYNYLAMGDDMVDLIRALHLQHVHIVSGYVATISALEVARQLPNVVRSLTLQEPVPANRSGYTDPTRYLSDAFKAYAGLCRADQACNASFPDLAGDLKRDYDTYRTHPRIAHGDDGNGDVHDVLIDGPRVAEAVYAGLQDSSDFSLLAAGIATKERSGAIDGLTAGRIVAYNASKLDAEFDWGAALSNQCAYEQYTLDSGRALSSSTSPELSGIDDNFLTTMCAAWPVRKLNDLAFADPNTNAPTFIVNGNLAPGTDPAWPEQFQGSLPNATVIAFPTLNGSVLNANHPKCLADLRRTFLANPSATLDVASCVRQSPPIQFATGP